MAYRAKYSGTRAIMRSAPMRRVMEAIARAAVPYAESIAPRDSGEYARSFRVESGVGPSRAWARIVNDAPHATLVEIHNGERVLGRTVDVIERST